MGVSLIPIEEGFAETQINCVIFRKDSISSYEDRQVVSYYDAKKRVTFAVRKINQSKWNFVRLIHKGNVMDAHNCISIIYDANGYLHTSYDHHNHPLKYRKSLSPVNGLKFSELKKMTGFEEKKVCYPQFYKDSKGYLYFFYRNGKSGNGNLMLKRYESTKREWSDIQRNLIDGENKRNAYWQIWIDDFDTIHLSWVWRETPNASTNHDVCYAKSVDGGITWLKSNNSTQIVPITLNNADYAVKIPKNSSLHNQTSITADIYGKPYIATIFRPIGERNPQYMLIYYEDNKWNITKIWHNPDFYELKGLGTLRFPLARPQILIDKRNNIYVILRMKSRNNQISIATSSDEIKKEWKISDLTDFTVDTWEPTMDSHLWQKENILHLLVQNTGFHKNTDKNGSQMLYVLEYNPNGRKT